MHWAAQAGIRCPTTSKQSWTMPFWGGCCSEEETEETIRRYWKDHNYLIDPHTAVAAEVLAQYRIASGDETLAVVVSTASPYKFCGSVLTAIGETPCGDGLELLDQLHCGQRRPGALPSGGAEGQAPAL